MQNPNPVIEARHMEGFSQEKLGKRLGFSKQYVSRAELGTYSGLSKPLLRWVSQTLGISVREADRQYKAFQTEKRLATVEKLNPPLLSRRLSGEPGHVIFQRWREGYWGSSHAFSVSMCVHPSSVENYEDGISPAIPEQVQLALNEVRLLDPNWSEKPKTGRELSSEELHKKYGKASITDSEAEALRAALAASQVTPLL